MDTINSKTTHPPEIQIAQLKPGTKTQESVETLSFSPDRPIKAAISPGAQEGSYNHKPAPTNKHQKMIKAILIAILAKLLISPLVSDAASTQTDSILLYMPDALILLISGTIFLAKKTSKTTAKTIAALTLTIISVSISSIINDKPTTQAITNLLKTLNPFILLLAVLSITNNKNAHEIYKNTKALSISIIFLTSIGFLLLPASSNRGEAWLPAYFSGLHSSSYIVLGGLLCSYSCYKFKQTKENKIIFAAYGAITTYLLLFGWGVRTGLLSLAIFSASLHLSRAKIDPLLTLITSITASTSIIIIAISLELISYHEFDIFTSGRLSMYDEKVQFLSNYNLHEWLLGKGYGSDLMISNIWWWAEKGSHNDFLTFLTENGVIFIASMLFIIYTFYSKLLKTPEQKAVVTIIIFSSLVSNGYLVRPLPFYCLILPIVLFALTSKKCIKSTTTHRPNIYHRRRFQGLSAER